MVYSLIHWLQVPSNLTTSTPTFPSLPMVTWKSRRAHRTKPKFPLARRQFPLKTHCLHCDAMCKNLGDNDEMVVELTIVNLCQPDKRGKYWMCSNQIYISISYVFQSAPKIYEIYPKFGFKVLSSKAIPELYFGILNLTLFLSSRIILASSPFRTSIKIIKKPSPRWIVPNHFRARCELISYCIKYILCGVGSDSRSCPDALA